MSEPKSYKSDSSDERWALIEPVIMGGRRSTSVGGHQGNYEN
ncbi:hypothetical protein [Streptomyces scopuliridis]